jgi:hypothetical protein
MDADIEEDIDGDTLRLILEDTEKLGLIDALIELETEALVLEEMEELMLDDIE